MAELADAHDSGSCGATHAGSSPVIRTKKQTNRIAMRRVQVRIYVPCDFYIGMSQTSGDFLNVNTVIANNEVWLCLKS